MATRTSQRQSEHDAAVGAAQDIYSAKGIQVWINPGGQKNKAWASRYIDVIALTKSDPSRAWVIEVETSDSVSDAEAKGQWKDYDTVYSSWYLAVPRASKTEAETLLQKHSIAHCTIITWQRNSDGTHTFWGLPGPN